MSKEIILHSSPTHEYGVKFFAGASLAATIALSGVVNYRMHDEGDHTWDVQVYSEQDIISSNSTFEPTGARNRVETRMDEVEGDEEISVGQEFGLGESPYAREYADDAAAEKVDVDALEQLSLTIQRMEQDGWSDFSFKVIGLASAEDDMTLADAGLGALSADGRNAELAEARALSFVDAMKQDSRLADIPIIETKAVEDTLRPEDIELLQEMSEQFGYESISEMIDRWNLNQDDAPPTVAGTLEGMLGNDKRGVLVNITAHRPVETADVATTSAESVCIVAVKEIKTNYTKTKPWHLPVPKFVIIPVPIVWPTRRRTASTSTRAQVGGGDDFSSLYGRYTNALPATAPLMIEGTGVGGVAPSSEAPKEPSSKPTPVVIESSPTRTKKEAKQAALYGPEATDRPPRNRKRMWKIAGGIIVATGVTIGSGFLLSQCDFPSLMPPAPADPCSPDMPRENDVTRTVERYVPANS